MQDTGLYIHIPFCDHKCIYCDFYSIITSDNINPFLQALKKEIRHYSELYSEGRKIISIFFGGGTPSLMSPDYLAEIIIAVKNNFYVADDVEITMESNPGTLNHQRLSDFRSSGINRISVGVQSFNDDELQFLTRIHDSKTAIETVMNAERAGYKNISIDLIFNLPGQTKEKWIKNLNSAVLLPINHLSAYSLILEKGTILNKMVIDGKVKLQDEDYDAELYKLTIDFLNSKGFIQYEVSNFSRPGYECVHNNCYWGYKDYFGFGPSAHSFINGQRWWNYSSLKMYISAITKHTNAMCSSEKPDDQERLNEFIMLALRSKGINLTDIANRFDREWFSRNSSYLNMLKQLDYIAIDKERISLTSKGYAICDEIILNLK